MAFLLSSVVLESQRIQVRVIAGRAGIGQHSVPPVLAARLETASFALPAAAGTGGCWIRVVRTATRQPQCGHGWTAVTPAATSARCWAAVSAASARVSRASCAAQAAARSSASRTADLVKTGREDTAAVQGLVAGRPELPGMGLAADFGHRHRGPGEPGQRAEVFPGQPGLPPQGGNLLAQLPQQHRDGIGVPHAHSPPAASRAPHTIPAMVKITRRQRPAPGVLPQLIPGSPWYAARAARRQFAAPRRR